MLENPKHPYFYCVGLKGISIGKKTVPASGILRRVNKRGDSGVVVDSGTTFKMLPAGFYNPVVAEFNRRVSRVHGGLVRKNYFYEFLDNGDGLKKKGRVGFLMLMNGGDEFENGGGPWAILGNYQHQGFEVEYDLENKRVGFARRKCASL
ncbi:hypothetical protein RYX36_026043 [Vicia faba]